MPVKNGYAAMVRKKAERAKKNKSKRRKDDGYETPENVTLALTKHVKFKGTIVEPACGSGRMMRVLVRETKRTCYGYDIKKGQDFLKSIGRTDNIVTNPPYRDNLPEAFARKALERAEGKVAFLVEGKWLWGSRRAAGLFKEFKPSLVIVLSSRIYFHQGSGKPIDSQFFSHCWVVWPEQALRKKGGYDTQMIIVDQNEIDS